MKVVNCVFAFKCPATWDTLSATALRDVRFCSGCQKNVHLCRTDKALAKAIRLNQCVAIDFRSPRKLERLLGSPMPPR